MLIDDQYRLIEPDTLTGVLKERGWVCQPLNPLTDVWRKGSLMILVEDGDQREALSAVFDYEGPEAVAEIWKRSQA
jgi:hypothetical protein